MTTLIEVKVAVAPEKVAGLIGLPLFRRWSPVIPVVGLPDPAEVMVKLVKVTGTVPVLVANI
jgi:hypothetical protein